jgi:hypothetical protein
MPMRGCFRATACRVLLGLGLRLQSLRALKCAPAEPDGEEHSKQKRRNRRLSQGVAATVQVRAHSTVRAGGRTAYDWAVPAPARL